MFHVVNYSRVFVRSLTRYIGPWSPWTNLVICGLKAVGVALFMCPQVWKPCGLLWCLQILKFRASILWGVLQLKCSLPQQLPNIPVVSWHRVMASFTLKFRERTVNFQTEIQAGWSMVPATNASFRGQLIWVIMARYYQRCSVWWHGPTLQCQSPGLNFVTQSQKMK